MIQNQLSYLERLFDVTKLIQKDKGKQDEIHHACDDFEDELKNLKRIVDGYLEKNARMYVNLSDLFALTAISGKT